MTLEAIVGLLDLLLSGLRHDLSLDDDWLRAKQDALTHDLEVAELSDIDQGGVGQGGIVLDVLGNKGSELVNVDDGAVELVSEWRSLSLEARCRCAMAVEQWWRRVEWWLVVLHRVGRHDTGARGVDSGATLVHKGGSGATLVRELQKSKWFAVVDVGERPKLKGVEERGSCRKGDPEAEVLDRGVEVRRIRGNERQKKFYKS
ncbi:hypothetical protein U1Q18_019986 [Sarracenia purpurea var. burkii]